MKNSSAGKGVFGGRTLGCVAALTSLILVGAAGAEQPAPGVAARTAVVNGLTLQYLEAGRGPAVVLLHGYAETSRMWRPLMPQLADRYRVIAPDLPGIGGSAVPNDGQDMSSAAKRIHALIRQLGVEHAAVVGHDIGLMVAYAYAAQFPDEVDRLILMDAFLPGVKGWEAIYNHPAIWLIRFIAGEKVGQQVATPPASSLPEMRLTPEEAREIRTGSNQIGSSYLPGVSTSVLVGDPSKTGVYAIVLSVPPNTTIPAHSHRDDRMATVISGTWQIGYGDRFDERALKT